MAKESTNWVVVKRLHNIPGKQLFQIYQDGIVQCVRLNTAVLRVAFFPFQQPDRSNTSLNYTATFDLDKSTTQWMIITAREGFLPRMV